SWTRARSPRSPATTPSSSGGPRGRCCAGRDSTATDRTRVPVRPFRAPILSTGGPATPGREEVDMLRAASEVPATARSQTDVVIDAIKTMLRTGELRRGSRLPIERDLASRFGVSRSSLREGVRALAALGVLEARQRDGTYVTSLDPATMLSPIGFFAELHEESSALELLAVRRVLEAEGAALAATRLGEPELAELESILRRVDDMLAAPEGLDPERTIEADVAFHSVIAHASGNSALAGLIDMLSSRTVRARLWRSTNHPESIRT